MRKKLWILNLLLVAAIALLGRELRDHWKGARERENRNLSQPLKPVPPVPVAPQPPPPSLQAAGYLDVAQQMLFTKDRNPNVVIEQAPPKPVPAFPRLFGVMNLGDGNMAILSDGPGRQRAFKSGEKVGEFLLAEINPETLVFEWDQKKFPKRFSELQERASSSSAETTRESAPAAAAPPPKPAMPTNTPGPGADMGGGLSACNANDSTPAGTVVDGKRKVVNETPFSKVCRWEPVSK